MKAKIKFFLVLCVIFIVEGENDRERAYEFINNLYKEYQRNYLELNFKGKNADTIFTPDLLKLIRLDEEVSDGEVGYLDWDPLCGCQDPEGLKIKKILIKQERDKVFADVDIVISESKVSLRFELKKINNKWFINDVMTKEIPSLYKYLEQNLLHNLK